LHLPFVEQCPQGRGHFDGGLPSSHLCRSGGLVGHLSFHKTFLRAYEFIMKEVLPAGDLLPPGQNYKDSAAMQRLHVEVVKLPTIPASKDEILQVIHGFKCVHHWQGGDARWLKKIGCHSDIIDLGLLYNRFIMPVNSRIETAQGMYGATQSIACVSVGGTLQPPHFSSCDAEMCFSTFLGVVERVVSQ